MTAVCEAALVAAEKTEVELEYPLAKYSIGQRVVYKAQFNNPCNYMPDELLSARVISRFRNRRYFTYRIEIDREWLVGGQIGRRIIMGNITEERLRPE